MPQEFKFVSGPGPPRAPPVSSSDWEKHKATIDSLWVARNLPLKQLMDTMQSEHNFAPSRKQYVLQLKKWGMHKYTPSRASANKRPHPWPSPDPQVVPDTLPSNPSPGPKRSRANDTVPEHESQSGVLSPDQESSGPQEGSKDHTVTEDEMSPDAGVQISASDDDESNEDDDGKTWMCFCGRKQAKLAELSEALIHVSSAKGDRLQMEDTIDRVESAADFFLYSYLEGDAFSLYALLLKWVLNHYGPLCQCTRDLVNRARTGCAISALDRSDLEVANALLQQTRDLSPLKDRQSLASWLLYESLFTWKLYYSRGLVDIGGWFTRLKPLLDGLFEAILREDAAVDWLKLGVALCKELLPFVKHSDTAERRLGGLLGRLQDNLKDNPQPSQNYSKQIFHTDAVRYCLQWMQDLPPVLPLLPLLTRDQCHSRGGQVCTLHGTNPYPTGPHFHTEFLACWARLTSELNASSVPVWVIKLRSSGVRPTKLLAVLVHGWEEWFMDDHGNTRSASSLTDEEITKQLKLDYGTLIVHLFDIQILNGSIGVALCRSAGRELVRDHLAVTPIPG